MQRGDGMNDRQDYEPWKISTEERTKQKGREVSPKNLTFTPVCVYVCVRVCIWIISESLLFYPYLHFG